MAANASQEPRRHLSAFVSARTADDLQALARVRDRSVSAEIRLALREHLELEDWRQTLSPGNRHDVFRAFRQSLAMSGGDYAIFFERPIATALLAIGILVPFLGAVPALLRRRGWKEASG